MTSSHEASFRAMIEAYAAGDRDAMATALSESLVAYSDEFWS